jgi:ABC-type branched-subunit amino acid transport system substrate-binding protein
VAYIGTYNSGAAKVSMPILNLGDLLMISPANTAVGLTKPGLGEPGEPEVYRPTGRINYARVVPADDLQGPLAADWAKQRGVQKVYILDDNEVYGKGLADLFDERCREIGITVLGHDSIDAKAQEFRSLMASIKAKSPDLLYFGGTTQSKGGQLAKDMASAGITAMLLVPDAEATDDRLTLTLDVPGTPPEAVEPTSLAEFCRAVEMCAAGSALTAWGVTCPWGAEVRLAARVPAARMPGPRRREAA